MCLVSFRPKVLVVLSMPFQYGTTARHGILLHAHAHLLLALLDRFFDGHAHGNPHVVQAGSVSVLFRQTNAVWVAFTLAVCLLDDFTPLVSAPDAGASACAASCATKDTGGEAPLLKPPGASEHVSPPPAAEVCAARGGGRGAPASSRRPPSSTTRKRKNVPRTRASPDLVDTGAEEVAPGNYLEETQQSRGNDDGDDGGGVGAAAQPDDGGCLSLLRLLLLLARGALADGRRGAPLLRARVPLAAPIVLFAVFVCGFNGGAIVLGDKENHSPGGPPHLAQLAYLVAVAASLWGVVGRREGVFGGDARSGFALWARGRGVVGVAVIVTGVAVATWR